MTFVGRSDASRSEAACRSPPPAACRRGRTTTISARYVRVGKRSALQNMTSSPLSRYAAVDRACESCLEPHLEEPHPLSRARRSHGHVLCRFVVRSRPRGFRARSRGRSAASGGGRGILVRSDEDAEAHGRLVRFVPQVVSPFRRGRRAAQAHYRNRARFCHPAGGSEKRPQSTPFPPRSVGQNKDVHTKTSGFAEVLIIVSRRRSSLFRSRHCLSPPCSGRASWPIRRRTIYACFWRVSSRRAAAESTLPTVFTIIPRSDLFHTVIDDGSLGGSSSSPGTSRRSSSPRLAPTLP